MIRKRRNHLGRHRKEKSRGGAGAMLVLGVLALGGCAVTPPTGPDVTALPGTGKSFEVFQADNAACKQYASSQIGGASPAEAANRSALNSTALGAALGAIAGAAIGAATGNPAAGAAIGAGGGLFVGGAAGLNAAEVSSSSLQRRYDMSYIQCMSAKGEQVPSPSTVYPAYVPYPAYYPPYYPYYGSAFFGVGFGFHHFHHHFSHNHFHHGHH